MSDWTPLSRREAGLPPHEPCEGVPDHLVQPLKTWAMELAFYEGEHLKTSAALRLRWTSQEYDDRLNGPLLLDVVDALLAVWARKFNTMPWHDAEEALHDAGPRLRRLALLLEDGGSVYRVRTTDTWTPDEPLDIWLERRVSEAETEAAAQAIASGTSSPRPAAGTDLAEAWRAAYGLHPDPSKAYGAAILAVEHAIIPLVEPNNRMSTLGKVIKELEGNQSAKWTFDTGTGHPTDLTTLVDLLNALWIGQVGRHGGPVDYTKVTQSGAEAAVHLAVSLVRWLTSGTLTRVTTPTSTTTP